MARPLRLWAAGTLLLGVLLAGFDAQAQDATGYPARPVKIIVPFAPAGPTDTMARLIAQKLSDSLGKQFYIENHPGAGGNLGMATVANAAPDGYTLLLVSSNDVAAQGKGIRFWNLTSATVSNFQLSPAGKNDWGANQTLNDKDKEVDHDERLRITGIDPGRYDAKVGYPKGRTCVVRNIEIAADAVFSIADKDLKDCTKK